MNAIRALSGLLAVAGIFWAYFGFIGVAMSILSVSYIFAGEGIPLGYLYLYFQAWSGFFIWYGWIARAFDRHYIVKRKLFWILSLTHHLFWLVPLIIAFIRGGMGHDPLFDVIYFGHVVIATAISAAAIFYDKEKTMAEPDAALNCGRPTPPL